MRKSVGFFYSTNSAKLAETLAFIPRRTQNRVQKSDTSGDEEAVNAIKSTC
jgi:hypothetical protein